MISPTPSRQPAPIRTTQQSYKDYVEQKKKDNEKPLSKDEWESKTQEKDKKEKPAKSEKSEEKKEPSKAEKDTTPVKLKKDLASLSSWATGGDAIQQVATHAQGGHSVPKHVVQKAKAMIESWLEHKDSYRIDAAGEKELKKHLKSMDAILKTGAALARLEKLAARRPDLRSKVAAVLAQHGCDLEGPMMGRFEEGKPADPTENMSPEDAKEWWKQNEANKDNFKGARYEEDVPADPTENMSPEDAREWWRQNEIHKDNFKEAAFGSIPDVGLLKNEAGQYLRIFPAKSMGAVQAMYTRYMNSYGHEVVTESSWIAAAKIFQPSDFLKDLQSPMDRFLFTKLPATDMALVKRLRYVAMGQDKQAQNLTAIFDADYHRDNNAKIRLAFAGILSH